jgi:hypothetical protein
MTMHKVRVTAAAALGCLVASVSQGAAWQFDPRLSLYGTFDDNRQLDSIGNNNSVTGLIYEVALPVTGQWPRTRVTVTPRVRGTNFFGDSDQNDDLEELIFELQRKGLRLQTDLHAEYSTRSTLRFQLPDTDIDVDLGETTGGSTLNPIDIQNRQNLLWAYPQFILTVNPRSRLFVRADFQDASYDESGGTSGFIDYSSIYGLFGYSYDVSPRSAISLRGSMVNFSPDQGIGESNTYGLALEWYRTFSETSKYYLRLGSNHTKFDAIAGVPGSSDSASTVSGGAGITWAFQVTGIFLDVMRNVSPSSGGRARQEDELRLGVDRQFSPRASGNIGVIAVQNRDLQPGVSTGYSRYASANIGFQWRFTKSFTLVGTVGHSWRKEPNTELADSNSVSLGILFERHRRLGGPGYVF